jgi:hypothetical protein
MAVLSEVSTGSREENASKQTTGPADITTSAAKPRPRAAAKVAILAKRMSEALMGQEKAKASQAGAPRRSDWP